MSKRVGWRVHRKPRVPSALATARRRKVGKTFVKGAKRIIDSKAPKQTAEKFLKYFLKTYGARYGAEALADEFASWGATKLNAYIGGRLAEAIDTPSLDIYGNENASPSVSYKDMTKYTGSKWNPNSKTIKISFATGQKVSRANYNCGKQNGIAKKVTFDSLRSSTLTDTNRTAFTVATGYNQKKQFMFNSSYTSFNLDYMSTLFDLGSTVAPISSNQRVYANVHQLQTKIRICNINKYLPVKMKIHFFTYEQLEVNYLSIISKCSNAILGTQDPEAMPEMYQLSTATPDPTIRRDIKVDPNSPGILASPSWKAHNNIVKTFSVKMNAGDICELTHNHSCGSGIRLDKLYGEYISATTSNTIPTTYGILFEMNGVEVDGYISGEPSRRYLGTSPCNVTFEFKRAITGALPPRDDINSRDSVVGGYSTRFFGIRVFQNETTPHLAVASGAKVKNWDEGNPALILPIMADLTEQDAGRIS